MRPITGQTPAIRKKLLSAIFCAGIALFDLSSAAHASTITFTTDPFAGTTAQSTPGRQVVANEAFVNFSTATDVFAFDPAVFGVSNTINFVNAPVGAIPSGGVDVIVLETGDNDNNLLTPFGATNAADLIASRITTPGPGFFIYFNQTLDLPRLVYSTDLSSSSADLKVLARMVNLTGATGRNALATFTAANFATIDTATNTATAPEPSSLFLVAGCGLVGIGLLRRKQTRA